MRTVNIHAAKTGLSSLLEVGAVAGARKSSSPGPVSRWPSWCRSWC